MAYILSLLIAAGTGSGLATGQGMEPGLDEAGTQATPPVIVNFQGHLRQGTVIVNGTYSMTFRLYNAAAGGTPLQTMGPWNITVNSGVFNVELPITRANILNYTNLWVEVDIPSLGGIYIPRVKINSAAFAYNAFMSDTTQRIRDFAVTPQDLVLGPPPTQLNDFDLNNNGRIDAILLDIPASGTDPGYIWNYEVTGVQQPTSSYWITRQSTVGTPADTSAGGIFARLRPESGGSPYAAFLGQRGTANGFGTIAGGFYGGYFLSKTQANNVGVYAWCDAAGGQGVYSVGNTATSFGVWGIGNIAGATGVVGAGNGAGTTYWPGAGVSGSSNDVGTFGYGNATVESWGVYGYSNAPAGASGGTGVVGYASLNNNTARGVWGFGNVAPLTYFTGREVGVQGNADHFGVLGIGQDRATTLAVGVWGLGANSDLTQRVVMSAAGVSGVGGPYSAARPFHTGVYGRPDVAEGDAREVEGALGTYWWYSINGVNAYIGVIGYENDAGTNATWDESWAALFDGDVFVTDDIYVGNWVLARGYYYHAKRKLNGKGGDLLAASPKSVYHDAMLSGTVNLSSGEAKIKLDQDFLDMVDPGSMRVTATAIGAPVTVYVAEITPDGFVLKSVDGSSCRVDWIVMAYQAGVEAKIDQSKASELVVESKVKPVQTLQAAALDLNAKTDNLKTAKTTHQRVPAETQELKEVK